MTNPLFYTYFISLMPTPRGFARGEEIEIMTSIKTIIEVTTLDSDGYDVVTRYQFAAPSLSMALNVAEKLALDLPRTGRSLAIDTNLKSEEYSGGLHYTGGSWQYLSKPLAAARSEIAQHWGRGQANEVQAEVYRLAAAAQELTETEYYAALREAKNG